MTVTWGDRVPRRLGEAAGALGKRAGTWAVVPGVQETAYPGSGRRGRAARVAPCAQSMCPSLSRTSRLCTAFPWEHLLFWKGVGTWGHVCIGR